MSPFRANDLHVFTGHRACASSMIGSKSPAMVSSVGNLFYANCKYYKTIFLQEVAIFEN